MLKINLIYVGKTRAAWLEEGEREYLKRLQSYAEISLKIIKAQTHLDSPESIKEKEAELISAALPEKSFLIVLDETGKQFSSKELAARIDSLKTSGTSRITVVIGGTYGLTSAIKSRADLLLSLSRSTFTHEMIRPIFLEQLYRAFTIIQNKTYHY